MFNKKSSFNVLLLFLVVALAFIVFIATVNKGVPGRDSGVFFYAGEQILKGKIPYKDFWDHKPPLIFYLNSLGLSLTPNSILGVIAIQFAFFTAATLLMFYLLKRHFNLYPAIIGLCLWLLAYSRIVQGGNLTEQYGLLFQVAAIYLFFQAVSSRRISYQGILLGVLLTTAFFLKPTLIGIFLAIFAYLGISVWQNYGRSFALKLIYHILISSLITLVIALLYLAANGALFGYIQAVFIYNFFYSKVQVFYWQIIGEGFHLLGPSLLPYFAVVAWIELYVILRGSNFFKLRSNNYIQYFLLIALPIEFYLIILPRHTYGQYYLAWLPVMILLTAFLLDKIIQKKSFSNMTFLFVITLLVGFKTLNYTKLAVINNMQPGDVSVITTSPIVEFIKANTEQNDHVLMWGAESAINFMAHRDSPTRFVYQYPLYVQYPTSQSLVEEFYSDINKKKPKYIIDGNLSTDSTLPQLDCSLKSKEYYENLIMRFPGFEKIVPSICKNYMLVKQIDTWRIWKLKSVLN